MYDNCTVLQADMVGFTPLSSKYPPEKVLGILSDIFERFDNLCEQHSVDKVKTIGDAYIVCAGAMQEPRPDDAARVVRMALGMQVVVQEIAEKEQIDVAVRIGVHTGRCTGGIIGTVRFHFDMWGGAVYGAVKMEETGEKGRVQISDTTFALIERAFDVAPHLGHPGCPDMDEDAAKLGVVRSYLIVRERPHVEMTPSAMLDERRSDADASGGWGRRPLGGGGWGGARAEEHAQVDPAGHGRRLQVDQGGQPLPKVNPSRGSSTARRAAAAPRRAASAAAAATARRRDDDRGRIPLGAQQRRPRPHVDGRPRRHARSARAAAPAAAAATGRSATAPASARAAAASASAATTAP